MPQERTAPFEIDAENFITIYPNEITVIVPYMGGTYTPSEENTAESSFSVAP